MKKLIITLLAAVLASGALAQTSFPDIPANHWAGDAVERIADLGIVIGFPDGTYRGNEAFTRYQAALVVSRMLDVFNDNVNSALALTQADVDSLRNAVQELASDVAAQGVRLSAAESAIAGLSDDAAATNARLDELAANLGTGDPAVLRDLQNQIASQRVALDTAQATAALQAAQARFRAEEATAEKLSVVAPRAGRVDSLPYRNGDQAPVGAPLAVLLVGDAPYARIHVPQPIREHVDVGDRVRVRLEGSGRTFAGEVRMIRSEPAFTPYYALTGDDASRLGYLAEVQLEPDAGGLPAGLPVRVEFGTGQ